MRRTRVMAAAVCAAALSVAAGAQAPAPRMLPLDNLGLEHLDIIVPDPVRFRDDNGIVVEVRVA